MFPIKSFMVRSCHLVLILLVLPTCIDVSRAGADAVALDDRLITQLTRPMQVIVDGKSMRDAINAIAVQFQLNVWLDRQVDPSARVELGPLGPTPFAALRQLAQSIDGDVMPIENVVLIGRPKWIDRTAATLSSMDLDDAPPADIAWDDLTPPHDALARAVGGDFEIDQDLPHDLWPAIQWRAIDRRVAVALILAQFNRRPTSTESIQRLSTEAATDRGQFDRQYRFASLNKDLKQAFQRASPNARAKIQGETLSASGRIAAHRIALSAVLSSITPKPVDIDGATFTIKQFRAPASTAFEQLSQMAGRQCRIESDAAAACRVMVAVEGTNLTLRELIDRVAAEAGVEVTWAADTIVISAPK